MEEIKITKNLNKIHNYNILSVDNLGDIENYIINNKNIKIRNIFKHGYEFLKNYNSII